MWFVQRNKLKKHTQTLFLSFRRTQKTKRVSFRQGNTIAINETMYRKKNLEQSNNNKPCPGELKKKQKKKKKPLNSNN